MITKRTDLPKVVSIDGHGSNMLALGGEKVLERAFKLVQSKHPKKPLDLSVGFDWRHFVTELDCSGQDLDELDLSPYPNLNELWCEFNNLSTIDLSPTPKLRVLYCDHNHLYVLVL